MISGSIDEFAIEYELSDNHGGAWLFGRMCYWIDGQMVGNYNEGTSLRDVMHFMTGIVKYCNKRNAGLLCKECDTSVFDIIEKVIFGDNDHRFDLLVNNEFVRQSPGVLLVNPSVDVFDGRRVYLLECGSIDRILFIAKAGGPVKSMLLPKGRFEAAVVSFYRWLENIYEEAVKQ